MSGCLSKITSFIQQSICLLSTYYTPEEQHSKEVERMDFRCIIDSPEWKYLLRRALLSTAAHCVISDTDSFPWKVHSSTYFRGLSNDSMRPTHKVFSTTHGIWLSWINAAILLQFLGSQHGLLSPTLWSNRMWHNGHGDIWVTKSSLLSQLFKLQTCRDIQSKLLIEKLFPYYIIVINTGHIYFKKTKTNLKLRPKSQLSVEESIIPLQRTATQQIGPSKSPLVPRQ